MQINEKLLNKYGFFDVWKFQKKEENKAAILSLSERLETIDAIKELRCRWENIFWGLLAGNVFDAGAQYILTLHN